MTSTSVKNRSGAPVNIGKTSNQGIARHACDTCRLRKTKCDRLKPECGRCRRLSEQCSYHGRRINSHEDLCDRMTELQTRLAMAEAQLAGSQMHLVPILPAPLVTSHRSNAESNVSDLDTSSSHHGARICQNLRDAPPVEQNYLSQVQSERENPSLERGNQRTNFSSIPNAQFDDTDLTNILSIDSMDMFNLDSDWRPSLDFYGHFLSPVHPIGAPVPEVETAGSLSAADIATLHQAYSDLVYHAFPFLNRDRFNEELSQKPDSLPLLSLSYSMALIGCTVVPELAHLTTLCYHLARKHIDLCEHNDSGLELANINIFQAFLFLIRYEIMDRRLTRAWITIGRAIRLSDILSMHEMDLQQPHKDRQESDFCINLPSTEDPLELEERRRSLWTLYVLESYVGTRTGMLCELGEARNIEVRLPAPGDLNSYFEPVQMPYLSEIPTLDSYKTIPLSSFAGCILMVQLALECFQHSRQTLSGRSLNVDPRPGFWDKHYALLKLFNHRALALDGSINATSIKTDPISFSLLTNLCATEIFLHLTAVAEAERQGLPEQVALESKRLAADAALRIAKIVQAHWSSHNVGGAIFNLQATFIAWPLAMALKALSPGLALTNGSNTSGTTAHVIHLLKRALDAAEPADGHWHLMTAPVTKALQNWDNGTEMEHARS